MRERIRRLYVRIGQLSDLELETVSMMDSLDMTAADRVRIKDLPITPEKVLKALKEKG